MKMESEYGNKYKVGDRVFFQRDYGDSVEGTRCYGTIVKLYDDYLRYRIVLDATISESDIEGLVPDEVFE